MASESAILPPPLSSSLSARKPATVAAWLASAVLATGALVLVYAVDPRTPGNYPPCLFLFLTGCYCPGCGTLRALHSLLHGNLRHALGYNTLTVALLPFLGAAYVFGFTRAVPGQPFPRFRISSRVAWVTLAVILTFWVVRNVPVFPLSVLAP